MNRLIRTILIPLIFFTFACEEQLIHQPVDSENLTTGSTLNGGTLEKPNKGKANIYPQSASKTFDYFDKWDQYHGGTIHLPNGSMFFINSGYLTPPPDFQMGKPVTITITADYDEACNQVIYSFSPHGSTFDPWAELTIDWSDFCERVPVLYYINDNGKYVKQEPDMIDLRKSKLSIYLKHFSRYAIATE